MTEENHLSDEEIARLLKALEEAYAEAGITIRTAIRVKDVDENGQIVGETLIDNREEEEIN